METTNLHAGASNKSVRFMQSRKGRQQANLSENLLFAMKHFRVFYVFMGEGEAKLNVAEKSNDTHCPKTTVPGGRSAEPFAGTDCRTPSTSQWGRSIAARSAPAWFL
jgi:hypothetical protein